MKKLIVVLVSIILLIVDNSIIPFFAIRGSYPSLLFTFAIAYSLLRGKEEGVFIGVVSGILQDIFFGGIFGVNCLLNLMLCFAASMIGEGIFKNKRLIPVVATFAITILKYVGVFIVCYFAKIEIDITKSIVMGLYNSVIMFLGYGLIIKTLDEEYAKRTWRFK